MYPIAFLLLIGCCIGIAFASVQGALFTSWPDGTVVNGNIYDNKLDVWINGGPTSKHCSFGGNGRASAGISPSGDYYFQVTDPPGKVLLSEDPISHRRIHVNDQGYIDMYYPPPNDGSPWAPHQWKGNYSACPNEVGVGLYPFADTPNNGGEYKAWITPVAVYDSTPGASWFGFIHDNTKTDNFKVRLADIAFNCATEQNSDPSCQYGICRCNGFELIASQRVQGSTAVVLSFNVSNVCQNSVNYITIGATGLHNPGGQYTGNLGRQYAVTVDSNGITFTLNEGDWQTPGFGSQFGNTWDIFNITVDNWSPTDPINFVGHEGQYWDQFEKANFQNCSCPNCHVVPNPCAPGWESSDRATNPHSALCDVCENDQGFSWCCLPATGGYTLFKSQTACASPSFTAGTTDPKTGWHTYCDCSKEYFPCPNSCSGNGICNYNNGTCNCQNGFGSSDCSTRPNTPTNPPVTGAPPTQPSGTTAPPTTPPTQPPSIGNSSTTPPPVVIITLPPLPPNTPTTTPCPNDCRGNGICLPTAICNCQNGWSGVDCSIEVINTTTPQYCSDYNGDCNTCRFSNDSTGLPCAWCQGANAGGFGCIQAVLCPQPLQDCSTGAVVFIPPTCPDNCSYSGVCVNNSICVCFGGASGLNCGSNSGLNTGEKAAAIAGGIIALIVLAGAAVVVGLVVAAKKTVDWVQLQNTAGSEFHNNPTHVDRDHENINPLHSTSPRFEAF